MAAPIRFYFDFVSAYSYPAMNRIERVAARWGRTVDWRCVPLPQILAHHGAISPRDQAAKFAHNINDLPRLCEMYELPVCDPFPPKVPPYGATLHRLVFWRLKRRDAELAKRFALAVDHRYFGTGREVRTAAQLVAACKAAGVDVPADEIRAAADDAQARKDMDKAYRAALADGMFGAPFFVLDGETFWGADRLDHVEFRLKQAAAPKGFTQFELYSNFTARNGPVWVKRGEGEIAFGFRADDRHLNPRDVVHGGWMTSFVDIAMAQGALHLRGLRGLTPTIHLEADFLAPIRPGQWVEFHPQLARGTNSMNFVHGVATADGEPVLRASGVFSLSRELRETLRQKKR
ncbi:MAG: DsbA family protein [Alphaproteobacteria bacterium]|jgi:2-hydroxychromene-2-carboxylate isomerase/acyl-coenzyme A thioesterase PaaI-like protein